MEYGGLIYLDHAATSFPKPAPVRREVLRCLSEYGGNPGRGAHPLSLAAAEKVYECRTLAAGLFGVDDPARVFFTVNTTQGINTVLKGLLRKGDHVLCSDLEHNAVWRPLYRMAAEKRITMDVFPGMTGDPDRSAQKICEGIARRLRPWTRLVVCTHASNICSATLPIREIAAFCHQHGLLLVVDGAQSAGHEEIKVDEWGIDALCLPGHKGLWGPQGCGMVILGKEISPLPLMEGGNGIHSLEGEMSEELPERYEAGTLPTPAIAGLCEGLRLLLQIGVASIGEYEKTLYRLAREQLENTKGIRLYLPEEEGSILLFDVKGRSAEAVGRALSEQGICVRSGYHCAALAHRTLGTPEGGAVRLSFGASNRLSEVERACRAIAEIAKAEI